MSALRSYATIFTSGIKLETARVSFVVMNILGILVSSAITIGIYVTAFAAVGGSVNGMVVSHAAWSLGLYGILHAAGMRLVFLDINDSVRSGSVEMYLIKPTHFVAHLVARRLGRTSPFVLMNFLTASAVLLVAVGFPTLDLPAARILLAGLLVVGGTLVSAMQYAMIGLLAFWLHDAYPILWLVDKLGMVLGGALVPVALFPGTLRLIAEWSPFGAAFSAAQFTSPDFLSRAPLLILMQGVWLAIFLIGLASIWRAVRRKIEVNGG